MKILFGVFDWGLGHATRDIPLIKELLKKNKVDIISTGNALKILKKNFKNKCRYYDIPSIYPPYTKTKFFQLNFTLSAPKMLKSLKYAREQSKKIIKKGYDKVISDCRYDVYDTPKNSYLINHQLRFKTLFGAERLLEKWLNSKMNYYKNIIVPDFKKENLSGKLSHNLRYLNKNKIKYIGILSHLKKLKLKQDIDYFFSLSGPEPQRTLLQEKIISKIKQLKGKIIIAGGNPNKIIKKVSKNVKFYSHLYPKEQENIMNRSKFIITRSGYTTIMELAELNKKNVLLIPTPGQTEQEYLGDYYEKKKYFHHVPQQKLQLKRDIEKTRGFKGFNPPWKTKESVKKFMKIINK